MMAETKSQSLTNLKNSMSSSKFAKMSEANMFTDTINYNNSDLSQTKSNLKQMNKLNETGK